MVGPLISRFYVYPKGVFEVLATGGDTALGGDDFDHLIADWIIEQTGIQPQNVNEQRELLGLATQTKIALTSEQSAVISWRANLKVS